MSHSVTGSNVDKITTQRKKTKILKDILLNIQNQIQNSKFKIDKSFFILMIARGG